MKSIIISSCSLPIPATKGGAVESIINTISDENEKCRNEKFDIISIYDDDAYNQSLHYKFSSFIYIKKNKFANFLDKILFLVTKNNKQYFHKMYVLLKIKKILIKSNYDKVIFENSGFLLKLIDNKKIAKKYKNHFIFHLHNDIPDSINKNALLKCKIISVSYFLRKKINRLLENNNKINFVVVQNGFDVKKYNQLLTQEEKESLLEKFNIEKNKKIILFVGRITKEKGVLELIDAFISLNREDTVLLIVGSNNFGEKSNSPFEKDLKNKFDMYNNKIKFTGYIDHDEIWKIYKLAYISVFPSIWDEPAGLTMIESLASGTPLITTNVGGIPEYVNNDMAIVLDKNTKLIDSIKSSICNVLDNYDYYKTKTKYSKNIVLKKFNSENLYKNFIKEMEK